MKRTITTMLVIAALLAPTTAFAKKGYVDLGWRPPTSDELSKRKAFENAKGSWSKKDGANEMYMCLMLWAFWGMAAREGDDTVPSVAGDLTYSFADAQMLHFANALLQSRNGASDEALGRAIISGYNAIMKSAGDDIGDKNWHKLLGKCYVHPNRWDFDPSATLTGPDFLSKVLDLRVQPMTPPYVKDRALRARYDALIKQKKFLEAANLGTREHVAGRKTTIYWNEVKALAEIVVYDGKGALLDEALLIELEKSWYPKHKRKWASNLLMQKRGQPAQLNTWQSTLDKVPGWAKQQKDDYLYGKRKEAPCNIWVTIGCNQ
ncbi:MAG: hypothetical protein AAFR88_00190 [Pseudomonadota bacterium]